MGPTGPPGAAADEQVLSLPRVDGPGHVCHRTHDPTWRLASLFLREAGREAVPNLADDEPLRE